MTMRIGMARKELIEAVGVRYRAAPKSERISILDEFETLTGYDRKHAIRVLRPDPGSAARRPPRNRLYDESVRQVLIVLLGGR